MSILIHNIVNCKYESGNMPGRTVSADNRRSRGGDVAACGAKGGSGERTAYSLFSPCLRGEGQDEGRNMRSERLATRKAKRLRKNLTEAESKLWRHIRLRQLGGFKFRRQHPVGPYVLDFACPEKKLAIEVDGGQHSECADYDSRRSAYLETHGYKVLRFWNSDVLKNIAAVKEVIFEALYGEGPPPPSSSPCKGEERVGRQGQRGKSECIKTEFK